MIEKRSDAPLYAKSKELHKVAIQSNSVWQCENLMGFMYFVVNWIYYRIWYLIGFMQTKEGPLNN